MIQNADALSVKHILDTEKDYRLIDVREKWEYEYVKIEGSENIPLSTFADNYNKLLPDDKLILYCHHGSRSYQACSFLVRNGFKNVINLDGGIDAWSDVVDPSLDKY